jgi:hypothetical protein
MTAETADEKHLIQTGNLRDNLLAFAFSATLFCSALLMFSIQPLIGKLLLPKLGGSPQVLNTCMVFFLPCFSAATLHAHYTEMVRLRRQRHPPCARAAVHSPCPSAYRIWRHCLMRTILCPGLMQTLLLSVGAPMFIISSTAPLHKVVLAYPAPVRVTPISYMRRAIWSGPHLALVSYPFLIEPAFGVGEQAKLMTGGFIALVVALGVCALIFYRHYTLFQLSLQSVPEPIRMQELRCSSGCCRLLLSFAPSSLLLGVTTFVSTDIASVPLFWAIPPLYLTTFVLVFARSRVIRHEWALKAQLYLVSFLATVMAIEPTVGTLPPALILHLLAFLTAMVCHGGWSKSPTRGSASDRVLPLAFSAACSRWYFQCAVGAAYFSVCRSSIHWCWPSPVCYARRCRPTRCIRNWPQNLIHRTSAGKDRRAARRVRYPTIFPPALSTRCRSYLCYLQV